MKVLKSLSFLLVLLTLAVFMSCNKGSKDDGVEPDRFLSQVEILKGTWRLQTDQAFREGGLSVLEYNGLEITIEGNKDGGSLTTNIGSLSGTSTKVWPATSNWVFSSDAGDVENPAPGFVKRISDGIVCGVTGDKGKVLTVSFAVPASARVDGVDGDWVFVFDYVQ